MGRPSRILPIFRAIFLVGGAMITAYSYGAIFYDIPFLIEDWRVGLGIGLAIFISMTIWYIADLYRNYVWWSRPKIILTPSQEEITTEQKREIFFPRAAILEVYNRENREISNCYATLLEAADIYNLGDEIMVMPVLPTQFKKGGRIEWQDTDNASDKCEITIAPYSPETLNVADTIKTFHFNLCNRNVSTNWMTNSVLHTVKIRVDGKFNNISMRPMFFVGYIYAENKFEVFEAVETTEETDQNGERKKTERQIRERHRVTKMVFKEGDWMKDKKLRDALDLNDKAEKPLTRKGFFKILRKVTKPKPTDQEKSKTSE